MNTKMKNIKKVSIGLLSVISIIAGLVFSPMEMMTAKAITPDVEYYYDMFTDCADVNFNLLSDNQARLNASNTTDYTENKIDGISVSFGYFPAKIQLWQDNESGKAILYMKGKDLAEYSTETIHTYIYKYKGTQYT